MSNYYDVWAYRDTLASGPEAVPVARIYGNREEAASLAQFWANSTDREAVLVCIAKNEMEAFLPDPLRSTDDEPAEEVAEPESEYDLTLLNGRIITGESYFIAEYEASTNADIYAQLVEDLEPYRKEGDYGPRVHEVNVYLDDDGTWVGVFLFLE